MLLVKIQADDTGEALEGFLGIQLIYLNGYVILLKTLNGIFRDIGIHRFIDFGDICSKYYMILGILFQIISGIRGIGDSLPGPHR